MAPDDQSSKPSPLTSPADRDRPARRTAHQRRRQLRDLRQGGRFAAKIDLAAITTATAAWASSSRAN